MPQIDLVNWRERASKAHSPYTQNYRWASDNSLIPSVIPEEDEDDEGWFDQERPPNIAHQEIKEKAHPGRGKCEAHKTTEFLAKQETNAQKRLAHRVRPTRGGVAPFCLAFRPPVTY